MEKKDFVVQKIGKLFDEDLRRVQAERMLDVDRGFGKPLSVKRLTNVIFKDQEALNYWNKVTDRIKKIPRTERIK